MSKRCSITPQIFNSIEYVNSQLFTEINNSLKGSLKGIELRDRTKSIYEFYKSKDFSNAFGDWQLYQAVKFNKLTSEQANSFNILYNGDIKQLESTINLNNLNDLFEPIIPQSVNNQIDVVSDINLLTGRPIIKFINNTDLAKMANNLGITEEQLEQNILVDKDIYLEYNKEYLTTKQLDRIVQSDDSIAVSYGLDIKHATDNEIFNLDDVSHNIDALSDRFSESEVYIVSKLTSSLLVARFDELKTLFKNLSDEKESNDIQNDKINKFITDSILDFSKQITTGIDELINKSSSSTEKATLNNRKLAIVREYNDLINTLKFKDANGRYSFLYRSVTAYLNDVYNIGIKHYDSLLLTEGDDQPGFQLSEVGIEANWSNADAGKIDRQKNVAQDIKFQIAQCVSKDYIANFANANQINLKYGILEPLSIKDIWSTFIAVAADNISKDAMIQALRAQNTVTFNGMLKSFIDLLESDDKLYNSYYSSIVLPLYNVKQLHMKTSNNGKNVILSDVDANYNAFARNVSLQQIKSTVQLEFENSEDYLKSALPYDAKSNSKYNQNISKSDEIYLHNPKLKVQQNIDAINKSTGTDMSLKYNWIEKRLTALGLINRMSMNDIHLYVSTLLNTNTEITSDPFKKITHNGVLKSEIDIRTEKALQEQDPAIKDKLLSDIANLKTKYDIVYNHIISDLVYLTTDLLKIRNNAKETFANNFNQSSTIQYLANVSTIRNYRNISLSYFNEDGNMEYSPQYPSFLSDLLKHITPSNSEINAKEVQEYLKDYLADPTMANNTFLYNHNKDGAGLFNILGIDETTGTPTIDPVTPINPTFVKYLKASQFSGIMYRDVNQGNKYGTITGDSWKLIQIQSAIRGEWFNPSSDSFRSYALSMPKYGLRHILKTSDGKYLSHRSILAKLDLLDEKGDIKSRTIDDLNDDSFIYNETLDNKINKNIIGISLYRLGDLKNTTEVEAKKLFHLQGLVRVYNNTFNETVRNIYTKAKDKNSKEYKLISENVNSFYKLINSKALTSLIEGGLKETDVKVYEKAILDIYKYLDPSITSNKLMDVIFKSNRDNKLATKLINAKDFFDVNNEQLSGNYTMNDTNNVPVQVSMYRSEMLLKEIQDQLDFAKSITSNLESVIVKDTLLIEHYKEFKASKAIDAIRKSVDTEIMSMQMATSEMLDIQYAMTDKGNRYVKSITPNNETQDKANKGRLQSPMAWNGKCRASSYTNNMETKGRAILLSDQGIPTGRIFKFHRLSFIKDGHKVTLNEYAKDYLNKGSYSQNDLIGLVARMNEKTYPIKNIVTTAEYESLPINDTSVTVKGKEVITKGKANSITKALMQQDIIEANALFDKMYDSFLDDTLRTNQERLITETENIAEELKNMVVDYVPPYINGTYEGNKEDSAKRRAYLISMHLTPGSTRESKDIDTQYNKAMLEVFLNDYIASVNIGEDILYGRQYEYKNDNDVNKRVNQAIRNGKSNSSNRKFNSLTISDVETITNMIDVLKQNNGTDLDTLLNQYGKEVEVGNGLSMITVDEYINRLKSVNMYSGKLEEYIKALTDPNTVFDTHKYNYVAEQLKYFLYARQANTTGILKGTMTSYQEKNSTIVLFPKMFNGTQYEPVINWMNEKHIDELNFLSASKIGGQPVFRLHDTYQTQIGEGMFNTDYNIKTYNDNGKIVFDDRIDRGLPYEDTNRMNVADYVTTYNESSLRVQQDTSAHIYDKDGVISTQFSKKTWVNMNDNDDYTINGKAYKGSTGSYRLGERGIFETEQLAISYNAKSDRNNLINLWGGIKNGKIVYDAFGNIDLDVAKITETISDYFAAINDTAMMRAFEPNSDGSPSIVSFNHPTIATQIESLLEAKVSKIVRQTLKQIHAPIMPDTFMSPLNSKFGQSKIQRDEAVEEYLKNGTISLTKEFIDARKLDDPKKRATWELRSERYEKDANGKEVFRGAEIITNVWDSKFDKYRKFKDVTVNGVTTKVPFMDIDQIPVEARTMVGTRIPHEGMQSSFVAEVVGFFNNDATQVMVPKHLSKRTGWDYDIDTVYLYPKHLHERNGKLMPVSYEYDTSNTEGIYNTHLAKITEYVKTFRSNEYNVIKKTKVKEMFEAFDAFKKEITELTSAKFRGKEIVISTVTKGYAERLSKDEQFKSIVGQILNLNPQGTDAEIEALRRYYNTVRSGIAIDYKAFVSTMENVLADMLNRSDVTEALSDEQINKLSDSVNQLFTNTVNDLVFNINSKDQQSKIKEKIQTVQHILKEANAKAKDKYTVAMNELLTNKETLENYNSLNDIEQLTRVTRENMIVDSLIARLTSKESTKLREKPNEYGVLNSVSNGINQGYGISNNNSNFANILDRMTLSNMNKDVAVLKANSVSNDNVYAIFGKINASLGDMNAVPIVITTDEFDGKTENEIKLALDKTVGNKNYQFIEGTNKIVVFSKNLANNSEGTWTNIHGNHITNQSSQITANILDAVKDNLGFNINTTTLNVLSVLANSPISHFTNLHAVDENGKPTTTPKDNAFSYSNLIIHQAIISKYLAQINSNERTGNRGSNKNKAMNNVRNNIHANIISLIHSMDLMDDKLSQPISLLDVFSSSLTSKIKEGNNKLIKDKIDSWISLLDKGQEATLLDTNGISADKVYNALMEFINKPTITSETYKFLNSLDSHLKSDALTIFEANEITKSIKLDIAPISNKFIFSHHKIDGYSMTKDNLRSMKSLTELNDIYQGSIDNGFYNIDKAYNKIKTSKDITEKLAFINFLDNQVDISKLYEQIDNAGNLVNKASLVLRTDKLGTSPNSSKTAKLMEDLSNLYLDLNAFTNQMTVSNSYTVNEVDEFVNQYSMQNTLTDKLVLMQQTIDDFQGRPRILQNSNGEEIEVTTDELTLSETPLFAKGMPIVKAVFPNMVDNTMEEDTFDFTKSVYPYFEAQLMYANHFSTLAFSKVMLSEKMEVKARINVLMARLNLNTNVNSTSKLNLRGRIINTIVNDHIFNTVPFFNGGINTAKELEVLRVIGKVDIIHKDNGEEEANSTIIDEKDVDVLLNFNTNITLKEYSNLSAAMQVQLLKNRLPAFANNFEVSDRNDIVDFLNMFIPQLEQAKQTAVGYHAIKTLNVDRDIRKVRQTFMKMYFNTNPFVRQTARDLIRYAFHTAGLKFGNNVAKYVDIQLYYKDISEYYINNDINIKSELDDPINQLWKYNEQLKTLENNLEHTTNDQEIDRYLMLIRRQMFDEALITPTVYDKKKIDQPTFSKLLILTVNDTPVPFPIIVESSELLKNSVFSGNETIRTKIPFEGMTSAYGFQKVVIPGSTNTYYYPFAKSLGYDFTEEGVVSKYKDNLEKPSVYIAAINAFDSAKVENNNTTIEHESNALYDYDRTVSLDARANQITDEKTYPQVITKSNKSYSETAKDIIANVDNVLYIGTDEFYKKSFASNKTIYTTLDTIGLRTLESIPFDKKTTLAIVGDTLSETGKTQEEVDAIVVRTIRGYHSLFPINSIKTIYKQGIGESVFKSTFTNTNDNEYIEVGEKENVHESVSLSDSSVYDTVIRPSITSTEKIIAMEEGNLTTAFSLRNYMTNTLNTKADMWSYDLDNLRDAIGKMNDSENKYVGLMKALDANIDVMDKVLEFLHNERIYLNGEHNTVDVLTVDIFKFINSSDTSNKTLLAKKFVVYKDIIKVAKNLLLMNKIVNPLVTDEQYNSFTEQEKDDYLILKKQIADFNAKLVTLKTGNALDSTGNKLNSLSREDYLNNLSDRVDGKIAEYFATIIYMYTRNPKFKDSKFSKTVQQIIDADFKESATITSASLAEIFRVALMYNEDLTFIQLELDSIRDTGSALIDNAMSIFSELKLQSMHLHEAKQVELRKILDKNTNLKNKSLHYDKNRSNAMRDKFIDINTGTFISTYDYNKFNNDVKQMKYNSGKYTEYNNIFRDPKVSIDIKSKFQLDTKFTSTAKEEIIPSTAIRYLIDEYGNLFSEEMADAKDSIISILNESPAKPINPIVGNSYFKLFSFEFNGQIHNAILELDSDNELIDQDIWSSISIEENSKRTTLAELLRLAKDPMADSKTKLKSHNIGYYETIDENTEAYKYHREQYFNKGLDTDGNLRHKYEEHFHIKFFDKELSKGRVLSSIDNPSTKLSVVTNPNINRKIVIKTINPNEQYLSERYNQLDTVDKQFLGDVKQHMQRIILDVFPTLIVPENFMAYVFASKTQNIGKVLKDFIGWRTIQEEHTETDLFGVVQRFIQADSLTRPQLQNDIKVRSKKFSETYTEYETDVLKSANTQLAYLYNHKDIKDKSLFTGWDDKLNVPYFKTFDEVMEYRNNSINTFVKKNADNLNYDLPAVLSSLSEELYNLKPHTDFESSYKLLTGLVNDDQFMARYRKADGSTIGNKMASMVTGKKVSVSRLGSDTNLAKALENWKDVLYKVSRVNSKFDQTLGVVLRYTSMNTMWLNYHTGVKNVMKGVTDILIESVGDEFFNRKHVGKAMNQYRGAIPNILASIHTEGSPDLISAIVKQYLYLFEDHTEGKLAKQTGGKLSEITNRAEAIAYSIMTGGEHFLQFTALLAMMHSHRIVNGIVMSKNEYIGHRKNKSIRKFLDTTQIAELDKYLEVLDKGKDKNYKLRDYIGEWTAKYAKGLTSEQMKLIKEDIKTETKKATEEFEGIPNKDGNLKLIKHKTVFEQFKYDDAKTVKNDKGEEVKNYHQGFVTRDKEFTIDQENIFLKRVQALNQSIHGIYNTIDRNALQNNLMFEIVFQFRKWIRPNWIRYMGVKGNYNPISGVDNNPFSERLGQNRSGAFQDFFKFMKTPLIRNAETNRENGYANVSITSFKNMIASQAEFFKNISFYYSILDPHEQANVKRAAQFAINTIVITAALLLAGAGYDPDKDKDKLIKPQSWLIYLLAGLQTEYVDLIPVYGWATFYNQTKKSTVPSELQLVNLSKLMMDVVAYPIRDEEQRVYQSGIYKGEDKRKVDLMKGTPILRQWHKEHYLGQSINYYGMFNPFVNSKGGSSSNSK